MALKQHKTAVFFAEAALDAMCILAAGWLAARMAFPEGKEAFSAYFNERLGYIIVFVVAWWVAAGDQRLFTSRRGESIRAQLYHVAKAAAIALIFSGFLVVFFTQRRIEPRFMLGFGACALVGLALCRAGVRVFLWVIRRKGYNFRQILFIGANERANKLLVQMVGEGEHGYQLAGVLDDDPTRMHFFEPHEVPYLGTLNELEVVLTNHVIDEVYICLPIRTYYERMSSIAYLCESSGTPIRLITDLFPPRFAVRRIRQYGDIPILSMSAVPEAKLELLLKRSIDLLVSSAFMLLVAWWLFPIVALCIKLESKGPVFFRQERVGLNHRRFKMIKFRSMVANAEELKRKLEEQNEAVGPIFKMRRDPRMTRIGRIIRKFSIDELPQFINVFVGHMSLVGPRPPLPREVELYTWEQRRRLSVRPGITGLQQVSGRSDLTFEQWVELDLQYIDNWRFMDDIRILIRTFEVVVLARGAA